MANLKLAYADLEVLRVVRMNYGTVNIGSLILGANIAKE